MVFDGWVDLVRVPVVGVLAYLGLVFLLRMSGKRTLSKMNAFDFVVTVALGSTLATVLLSDSVALAEGMLAFAVLIFLQYAITWGSVRSPRLKGLVKAQPALVAYRGRVIDAALLRERVTAEEILAAVRSQGVASLETVEAVVLETDGSFSVIADRPETAPSALATVTGVPPDRYAAGRGGRS